MIADAELLEKIDAIARPLADEIATNLIADLNRQGVFDMVGEGWFRQVALRQARLTVIDRLNESLQERPHP